MVWIVWLQPSYCMVMSLHSQLSGEDDLVSASEGVLVVDLSLSSELVRILASGRSSKAWSCFWVSYGLFRHILVRLCPSNDPRTQWKGRNCGGWNGFIRALWAGSRLEVDVQDTAPAILWTTRTCVTLKIGGNMPASVVNLIQVAVARRGRNQAVFSARLVRISGKRSTAFSKERTYRSW